MIGFREEDFLRISSFAYLIFLDNLPQGMKQNIYNLFHQLVINMWKYLPQKGKVCKNNSSLTEVVIFVYLSLFQHSFLHVNHNSGEINFMYTFCFCYMCLVNKFQLFDSPITRRQILDSSRQKELADDNFKFDENGSKLSKWVENIVGKGEIAC